MNNCDNNKLNGAQYLICNHVIKRCRYDISSYDKSTIKNAYKCTHNKMRIEFDVLCNRENYGYEKSTECVTSEISLCL